MKKHLRMNWWKYLLAILLPVALWTAVFSLRDRPDAHERLRVLIVGEGVDTAALQADLEAALPSLTAQPLKEITVKQELPESAAYGEWLISREFSYDILIFAEPWCAQNVGQNYFSRMSDGLLSRFPSVPLYRETADGRSLSYALALPDAARFRDYAQGGAWLLFFSPESVNLGAENGKGEQTDDAAVAAAQYLSEAIH